MCKYITIAFLLVSAHACAQSHKIGFEIDDYKHTITFLDHKTVFQLQPIDRLPKPISPEKKYFWYSNNQIKMTQGGYSGKLLHGLYSDFYENKNLKEQGRFDMGLKEGEWNTWAPMGTLLAKINFKKGVPNGKFDKYNEAGSIIESGHYSNGLMNGKLVKYFTKDSVAVINYKKGMPQAKTQSWVTKLWKKKSKPIHK